MDKMPLAKKFSQLSLLHKVLLFVAILVGTYGLYWYLVLDDRLIQIAKTAQSIEQVDREIANFRIQVAKLPELEKNLEAMRRELYYAKTLLPEDNRALEMLLASFENIGREENVAFVLFQPGAETQHDFYATRSVQLQISGTYHRLMTYFDKLSRLDRLVTIQDVTFSPVSDFSPTEKYLNVNLVLQVYRALSEAEIAAREAQKQKKK